MKKFKDYLIQLRARSESSRRRIAFTLSLGLTLVIALFWVINFRFSLESFSPIAKVVQPETKEKANQGVVERIKAGWQNLQAAVVNLKK